MFFTANFTPISQTNGSIPMDKKIFFYFWRFHSTETIHLAVIAKLHLESHYSSAKLDGRAEKDDESIQELSQSVFQERQPNKTSQTEWNTSVTLTQGQRHSFHWDILVLNPAFFFFFYFLGIRCKSLDSADSACWLFSRGRKFLQDHHQCLLRDAVILWHTAPVIEGKRIATMETLKS